MAHCIGPGAVRAVERAEAAKSGAPRARCGVACGGGVFSSTVNSQQTKGSSQLIQGPTLLVAPLASLGKCCAISLEVVFWSPNALVMRF